MAVSKVVFGNETVMDLTADTVTKEKLLKGATAHGADGEKITGTCEYDVNSSVATANAEEVLSGKTFARSGEIRTGTMKNNGAVNGTINTKDGTYNVPQGFHDGGGKVGIADSEKAKLIPENIRQGVTVLGVQGEMYGTEDAKAETVTVTPSASQVQTILPNTAQGYNYLAQVTVEKIPYTETDNSAGGKTATIA